MKFKSTVIVIFISLIVIATLFVFTNSDTILKKKIIHNINQQLTSTTKHTGYLNGDLECNANCLAKDGISCGTAWQNCCIPSYCNEKWYGAEKCEDEGRIEIPGCTEKLI